MISLALLRLLCVAQLLADMIQQTRAGVFDQIEHLREAFFAAIVRVGYHGGVMLSAEFCQAPEFAPHRWRADMFSQRQIIPVHGQQ